VAELQTSSTPPVASVQVGIGAAVRRFGLLGAVLVSVLAPMSVAIGAPQPVRLILGLALIAWAPGHCAAVVARVVDPVLFVAVALAVSLSTSVVLATGLFYLGTWSALAAMLLTAVATVALASLGWKEVRSR
jgi:hypothetical protein